MNSYMMAYETVRDLPGLVKGKRRAEGLTFLPAAKQIGISVSTLHRIESDLTYNIGTGTILRLLTWLAGPDAE